MKLETAAVEVDRHLEVLLVAVSASIVLDPLDLGIETFSHRIGDAAVEVCQHVGKVSLNRPRRINDGL